MCRLSPDSGVKDFNVNIPDLVLLNAPRQIGTFRRQRKRNRDHGPTDSTIWITKLFFSVFWPATSLGEGDGGVPPVMVATAARNSPSRFAARSTSTVKR